MKTQIEAESKFPAHGMFPATVMWRNDLFHGLKFGGHPDALAIYG